MTGRFIGLLLVACVGCGTSVSPADAREPLDASSDATSLDAFVAIDARMLADVALDAMRPLDARGLDADRDAALAPLEDGELSPGGDTTTSVIDGSAFLQQAANLTIARRADFEAGLQFFRLDWEVAPGRPEADGLGPLFNAVSCIACHARNGRGAPSSSPDGLEPGVLLRLGPADGTHDPVYGDQLQPLGIGGVPGEGRARRLETLVAHALLDGTTRTLTDVRYEIALPAYGALPADTRISPRIAQQLVGQGLLEAIPEADLLALTDEHDTDGDGISGRARFVDDAGTATLGRFGWKAGQPSVEAQTSAAFVGDVGITSSVHPEESCTPTQTACLAATSGGSPELTATRLRVTASYIRLLGVPARRDGDSVTVRRGRARFEAAGCARCHHASFTTAHSVEPELADQLVWPYTDLLLHDMGDRLADGRAEGDASGREWRTPPLWGIGLLDAVNGATHLLHDGRARTIDEAILWHDGEGTAARLAYEALSEGERAELVAFVSSL